LRTALAAIPARLATLLLSDRARLRDVFPLSAIPVGEGAPSHGLALSGGLSNPAGVTATAPAESHANRAEVPPLFSAECHGSAKPGEVPGERSIGPAGGETPERRFLTDVAAWDQ
jgi:hypothetical protein